MPPRAAGAHMVQRVHIWSVCATLFLELASLPHIPVAFLVMLIASSTKSRACVEALRRVSCSSYILINELVQSYVGHDCPLADNFQRWYKKIYYDKKKYKKHIILPYKKNV